MNVPTHRIRYLSDRNPIQRVNSHCLNALIAAQRSVVDYVYSDAAEFYSTVIDDMKLSLPTPIQLKDRPAQDFADQPFADLVDQYLSHLKSADLNDDASRARAQELASRTQLLRAFEEPDIVLERVTEKVHDVVMTFPRSAEDLERGRNPGDVLDPYILMAAQLLLYGGDFQKAIGASVSHKALMIIEGLMGHLHEDVIGMMRGNIRAPEPRGFNNKDKIDLLENPFPGADVVQPPTSVGEPLRFHQVKSKTGSAKGGDGRRLGEQLRRLRQYYKGEVYFDALIGNTLRGHRSKGGVLASEPSAIILVGEAAFRALTRSSAGPELLLRVYQAAFEDVFKRSGYEVDNVASIIASAFQERSDAAEGDFSQALLKSSIGDHLDEQDSRSFKPERGSLRS